MPVALATAPALATRVAWKVLPGYCGTVKLTVHAGADVGGIVLRHPHIEAQFGLVGDGEQRRGGGRAHRDQSAHIHRAAGDDAVEGRDQAAEIFLDETL